MPLQLITPPSAEPIHLKEALAQIKQFDGFDDAAVLSAISAARLFAENKTWRQLVAARYKQTLDSFPGHGQSGAGVPWGRTFGIPGNAIVLDKAPVLQVESIMYLDMGGVTQTVDPATYTVDYSCDPCRITPTFGRIWPISLPQIVSAWVTFSAGFAAPIAADITANTLTVRTWKTLSLNEAVRFSNSGGILPAPLQLNTDYFIVASPGVGVYQVSATVGGSVIDLMGAGSGTSYIGELPADILAWMRLRIGSLYAYREEAIALPRGKIEELPFFDGLLDGYSTW